jgi:hypothetical protein
LPIRASRAAFSIETSSREYLSIRHSWADQYRPSVPILIIGKAYGHDAAPEDYGFSLF